MKHIFLKSFLSVAVVLMAAATVNAQQLPDPSFEDWSGDKFDGNIQPKYWHGSNVEQAGFKFNFTNREAGHTGNYCAMVQNVNVEALGIGAEAPGYLALGQPWAYFKLSGLDVSGSIKKATAGTYGGINFTYRPDALRVWVKRTGSKAASENFNIVFYSWKGNAKGASYLNKGGSCTDPGSPYNTNEESDIRIALNKNMCSTTTAGTQIAEGWLRDKKTYSSWTQLTVPIYYLNNETPEKVNVIFSAGNYPNFRDNNGINAGNALYVDDVELLYYSNIDKLFIGGEEWDKFQDTEQVQTYTVAEGTTAIPAIYGMRGCGVLENDPPTHDTFKDRYNEIKAKVTFPGRRLTDQEMTISGGQINGDPVVITVKAADGSSTHTYKIKFVTSVSTNAKLAGIQYNGTEITGFNASVYNYDVSLPYGTTAAPAVTATKGESSQTVQITQATSPNGNASIKVTAQDGKTTATYTVKFTVRALDDITLKDILIDGKSLTGFKPTKRSYTVNITSEKVPTVTPVSAYTAGLQTIKVESNTLEGGCVISVKAPATTEVGTYTLKYKVAASDYAYLADIKVGGTTIAGFDPEVLEYAVSLPLGTTTRPAITWTTGDQYQTVEEVSGGIDGITRLTVTAGDKTTKVIYKISFSTAKSSNCSLAGIFLDGKPLEGFSEDQLSYNVTLPTGVTTLPEVTYTKGDEYQIVTVTPNQATYLVRILVVAGDGTKKQYQIQFAKNLASDPTLLSIMIDGKEIEGFESSKTDYYIELPTGTTELPVISFTTRDDWQNVTTRSMGVNGDYKITVRAQSGDAIIYIIHFSVTQSSNTQLAAITFANQDKTDFVFDAATTEYTITLPEGAIVPTSVSYEKAEASQKVIVTRKNKTYELLVTAENGSQQTYILTFVQQVSAEANLKNIYLDGEALIGFDSKTYEYSIEVSEPKCPVVTVEKSNTAQQVSIIAPISYGTVQITVVPEGADAGNTYLIHVDAPERQEIQLAAIYADGKLISGYEQSKGEYDVVYQTSLPIITYDKGNEAQIVTETTNTDSVVYVVTAGEYKKIYVVRFIEQKSSDATLSNLTISAGELTPAFNSGTYNYSVLLKSGDELPTVSYTASSAEAHLLAGMTGEKQYTVQITAQDGITQLQYTVDFEYEKFGTTELLALVKDTEDILEEGQHQYDGGSIDKGAQMPMLTYEAGAGQTTAMTNTDNLHQEILVVADDNTTATYNVAYTTKLEANPLLNDIQLYVENEDGFEWISLPNFDKNGSEFTYELPWRTRVVPCIHPVGAVPDQEITISYGAVDSKTTIYVLAEDGLTSKTYTLNFPVWKSDNALLKSLTIVTLDEYEEEIETPVDVNLDEYAYSLPLGTSVKPEIRWAKALDEQQIEVLDAPLDGTTQIIVTAENGDKRTYNITFPIADPEGENILTKIGYVYIDYFGNEHEGEIAAPSYESNNIVDLPYGVRDFVVTYEKNYAEQTVFALQGGLFEATKLQVYANKEGETDKTYTITTNIETQNPAVLESISVNGTPIADFDKNRFSYVVNVTSSPIVTATGYNGTYAMPMESTTKHWKAQVMKEGFTNEYEIWFYYSEDIIPNNDFNNWETAKKVSSAKSPVSWTCLADVQGKESVKALGITVGSYTPGDEVTNSASSIAKLTTKYNATLGGIVPGTITLGDMSSELRAAGNSRFGVSGSIEFRNSPDMLQVRYSQTSVTSEGKNLIEYTLNGNKKSVGYGKSNGYTTSNIDLSEINANAPIPATMNLTICSAYSYEGREASGLSGNSAEMLLDWVKFVYNSTLVSAKVNNEGATLSGKNIKYTMPSAEERRMPTLSFTGEVSDQAQKIDWENEGAEVIEGENAIRRATVRNFAEDGGYTDYSLEITRPLSTVKTLASIEVENGYAFTTAFDADNLNYIVDVPYKAKRMPDVRISRGSELQTIEMNKEGDVLKYKVTAENGDSQEYTVTFRRTPSADATLQNITCDIEGGINYDAATTDYSIQLAANAKTPAVDFVKNHEDQTVDVVYTNSSAIFTVTAQDGNTTNTYTLNYNRAAENTTGAFTRIIVEGVNMADFASDKYRYDKDEKEQQIAFVKEYNSDVVVETITQDSVEWKVMGNLENTYKFIYRNEPSANTNLAGIYVNGSLIEDWLESTTEYTVSSDSAINLSFVPAQLGQTIQLSLEGNNQQPASLSIKKAAAKMEQTLTFVATVTAEDGIVSKTYKVTVQPELSDNALLAMIYADGEEIEQFEQSTNQYHIVLANQYADMPKLSQPKIPNLSYLLGQESQKVEVLSEDNLTKLIVTSEDGLNETTYEVYMDIEPSHYADFSSVSINNKPLTVFRQDRNYYYIQVDENEEVIINYTAQDRYQTVSKSEYIDPDDETVTVVVLTITAEDGTTQKKYEFAILRNALSSDAHLANITLDGISFADYAQLHNITDELKDFEPSNPYYTIPLMGETQMPDIDIFLKEDGQQYEVSTSDNGYTKIITVTAINGAKFTYQLEFKLRESNDASLQAIYIDNEPIDFRSDSLIYNVGIFVGKEGNEQLPTDILPVATDWKATVQPFEVTDNTIITVVAENGMSSMSYTLNFNFIYSDADTLNAITADNQVIEGFRPDSFYYSFSLPIGDDMPVLDFDIVDEYQDVEKAVIVNGLTTTTQFTVVAGSGKSNVYTVVYERQQSSNANLSNILIDGMPLADFNEDKTSYTFVLPIGTTTLPDVTADEGDQWQQEPKVEYGALEDYTYVIGQAQDGTTKTYSIRFTVALSDNPYLAGISVSNELIRGFQAEVLEYLNITLPYGTTTMPLITFDKAELAQTVTIEADQEQWNAKLHSVAADGITSVDYSLHFNIRKSDADTLAMIYLAGEPIVDYDGNDFEYDFTLPYGTTNIPAITWDKGNEQQTVTLQLPDTLQPSPWDAVIRVVSGSEDYDNSYRLRFTVEGSSYSLLEDILLQDESVINEFVQDTASGNFVYSIRYAPKTPQSDYYQTTDLEYVLGDEKQIVSISDTTIDVYFEKSDTILPVYYINLMVQAENGNVSVYEVEQYSGLSNNALLKSLTVNNEPMRQFCDTVFDYQYLVFDGVQSVTVEAEPQEADAYVIITPAPVGDTTIVRCVAADGTRAIYRVKVETTEILTAQKPSSNDVVLKNIGGGQFLAMSLRDNVQIAVYDMYGHKLFMKAVPVCNPNSVKIDIDSFNQDMFYNGDNLSNGTIITLEQRNTPYFYVFYFNSRQKITSGKLMVTR